MAGGASYVERSRSLHCWTDGLGCRVGPRAANAHLEDCLEEGKLLFDYRLQSGVVETSNALNRMRSIGLDV